MHLYHHLIDNLSTHTQSYTQKNCKNLTDFYFYSIFWFFFFIWFNYLESEPHPEQVAQLAQEVYNTDLLIPLVNNLSKLEFEVKWLDVSLKKLLFIIFLILLLLTTAFFYIYDIFLPTFFRLKKTQLKSLIIYSEDKLEQDSPL